MNRWLLPAVLSIAAHAAVMLTLPDAVFPARAQPRPAVLKARLVTLPPPAAPAAPESGGIPREQAQKTPAPAKPKPAARQEAPARRQAPAQSTPADTGPLPGFPSGPLPDEKPKASPPAAATGLGEETPPKEEPRVDNPREAGAPDILYRKHPLYPLASRKKGESGTVVLTVRLDAQGRVREVAVRSSSGFPALDNSALSAVRAWRFDPKAPRVLFVPVVFRLE